MKIAFAMINCNRREGSARAVNEVAERLARRHEVHLFARNAEEIDLSQIKWHRIPGPGWPDVADFASYHWQVDRRIGRYAFDIVHSIGCNSALANVITIQNIQPAKMRVMQPFQSKERVSLARRLTRTAFLHVTSAAEKKIYETRIRGQNRLFLPVSAGVRRELEECYDIGDAPVRIVPNAANTSLFKPLESGVRSERRQELGIAPDQLAALFTGGEWMRKGLDIAIRTVAASPGNWKLLVAGEDPARKQFETLALECGVSERVKFLGFRRDVERVAGACDFFFFPSHYEAFSLATIEAAACGLPIFGTRINGTEDFVRPGVNGEFVPPDPAGAAQVLAPYLAAPEKFRELGDAARALVEAEYTWERVAEQTEQAYVEYLSKQEVRACVF